MPSGYTKDTLTALSSVDVSKNQNGSIMAYYDGSGNIYVYSDYLIFANEYSSYMFYRFESLTSLDVSNFDTSNVTAVSWMFSFCSSLTTLNVSSFDTSNVTDMSFMFAYCYLLETIIGIENFDTSKVINLDRMFNCCESLTSLNLNKWDTSNVNRMYSMFKGCKSLTTLNIDNFDTSNVTDMCAMFRENESLTTLNVSSFDTSNVTDMSYMFAYCSSLTTIYVSDLWNINSVSTSNYMFCTNTLLVGGNGTKYNSSYTDKTYARIDMPGSAGYFTRKGFTRLAISGKSSGTVTGTATSSTQKLFELKTLDFPDNDYGTVNFTKTNNSTSQITVNRSSVSGGGTLSFTGSIIYYKSVEPTLIGTYSGTYTITVDCTSISNYDKLSVDNFVFEVTSVYSASESTGTLTYTKSYDASTGTFTISRNSITGTSTIKTTGKLYYIAFD